MNSLKNTLFISDLHLDENNPEISDMFELWIKNVPPSTTEAIYILGDLFEAWIGDDDLTPFHNRMIKAIRSATDKGIPVYLMHGNRDFLLGKAFLERTGCRLLSDPSNIQLYQQSALVMHGDTLCTRDIGYLKARRWLRNVFLQQLFLLLPLSIRKKIAARMRKASQQHTRSASMEMMDVAQQEVVRMMKDHHVSLLIHGHTHHQGIHRFQLNDHTVSRIVLGAWHHQGSILVCDETGTCELMELTRV
jgi:UDP-2,3-diacylglucosamine hydrolase